MSTEEGEKVPPHYRQRWVIATSIFVAGAVFLALLRCPRVEALPLGELNICRIKAFDPFLRSASGAMELFLTVPYLAISLLGNLKQLWHYYDRDIGTTGGVIKWTVGCASKRETTLDIMLNTTGLLLLPIAALMPTYWFIGVGTYAAVGWVRCVHVIRRPEIAEKQARRGRPSTIGQPFSAEISRSMVLYWKEKFGPHLSNAQLAEASLRELHQSGSDGHSVEVRAQMVGWCESFSRIVRFALCAAAVIFTLAWREGSGAWMLAVHYVALAALVIFLVESARGTWD